MLEGPLLKIFVVMQYVWMCLAFPSTKNVNLCSLWSTAVTDSHKLGLWELVGYKLSMAIIPFMQFMLGKIYISNLLWEACGITPLPP